MMWRIIKKTAIQKVFTAMIAFFLITLILFMGRQYWVASICLAGFCVLSWRWGQLLGQEIVLGLLLQNAGRMRFEELLERFTEKNAEGIIKRLIKKDMVRKENDLVILMGPEPLKGATEDQESADSSSDK